jgi:hypothetical protein
MPLSLCDLHHLEAAEGWLERSDHANCFDELERIDYNNRGDARELALRWKLYNADGEHVAAAKLALDIQNLFPDEAAGYVWRSVSLNKLGCTQDAYENLERVACKFDGMGTIPYMLAVTACQMQRMDAAWDWLKRAFETEDSRELRLRALEEESLQEFWPKIGEL